MTARSLGRLLAVVAGWTIVGFVFALPGLAGNGWRSQLLGSLAQWWSWGLMAPAIIAFDRRWPFSGPQLLRRVPAHLLFSIGLTAVYVYVYAAMRTLLGMGSWGDHARTDQRSLSRRSGNARRQRPSSGWDRIAHLAAIQHLRRRGRRGRTC